MQATSQPKKELELIGEVHEMAIDDIVRLHLHNKLSLAQQKNKQKFTNIMLVVVCVLLIGSLVYGVWVSNELIDTQEEYVATLEGYKTMTENYNDLTERSKEISEQNVVLNERYSELVQYVDDCEYTINILLENMETVTEENEELVAINEEYKEMIETYQTREELYDEYGYALYTLDGNRTDITYDQLTTLETITEDYDIDMDLILAITMVESEGDETALNESNGAKGYGQFLDSSGLYVYETIMGNGSGTYSTSFAYDGITNWKMMCAYLDHIRDITGSTYEAIEYYRGVGGTELDKYIGIINLYLAEADKTLDTVNY